MFNKTKPQDQTIETETETKILTSISAETKILAFRLRPWPKLRHRDWHQNLVSRPRPRSNPRKRIRDKNVTTSLIERHTDTPITLRRTLAPDWLTTVRMSWVCECTLQAAVRADIHRSHLAHASCSSVGRRRRTFSVHIQLNRPNHPRITPGDTM